MYNLLLSIVLRRSRVGAACVVSMLGCQSGDPKPEPLSSELPLHLEAHLGVAHIEGSDVPEGGPQPVEWRFDQPQPTWKPIGYGNPKTNLPRLRSTDDALQLTLNNSVPVPGWRNPHGGIFFDVPGWSLEDWAYVIVRARSTDRVDHLELGFNVRQDWSPDQRPVESLSGEMAMINDGSVQSYLFRVGVFAGAAPEGDWKQLAVYLGAEKPVTVDILSVTIVPKEADYSSEKAGVRNEMRSGEHRRVLYTHAPAKLEYHVRVPEVGRLDVGLGVLRSDVPVTFRVTVSPEHRRTETLFEESYSSQQQWGQRSIDLSRLAGEVVTLALESDAQRAGTVALWAAPTLSGVRTTKKPNIIFYVIDGAGADFMSVYGYNRRTTPNIERLAAGGVVFERAFSNSTWSKPSTASFMTSLHHSVLGGYSSDTDPLPDGAVTMAQHMHRAGYQTAVFSSNPYAATLSGLERGVDVLRETGVEPNNSESSRLLHEAFWKWREATPAEPYWVHFQTTDIHEPFNPVAPFSGIYVSPELQTSYREWDPLLYPGGGWRDPAAYKKHGIDRVAYAHAQQGLYDEAMAHNDYQIGRLVERLKRAGEWENTLLIIAADHGYPAACHRLMDPLPPDWAPMFNAHETRIPLIFVWPGRIKGGHRFSDPVSMVDVLPTVLDLTGLPIPDIVQGQSLAPLLLDEEGWSAKPVILEEVMWDRKTGDLSGLIEVIDGRWGASLEINPGDEDSIGGVGVTLPDQPRRPTPLLLYDLWTDPYTLHSLHEEHPDLVEKYTTFLEERWKAHQSLAERFPRPEKLHLTQDQTNALRALGYIQ